MSIIGDEDENSIRRMAGDVQKAAIRRVMRLGRAGAVRKRCGQFLAT
jgi:hypothetical protein